MDKIKSLLINHGEKILAAVCALFGFLALSSAHWSPDNRVPDELVNISNQKRSDIDQNIWPEEEKELFSQIKDVRALTAVEQQHKIDPADFQIGPINPALHRAREKRSLVAVVAPDNPVADAITITIAMPPKEEEEEEEGAEGAEGTDPADADEKDEKEMTEEETLEKMMKEKYGLKPNAAAGAGAAAGGYPGGEGESGGYPGGMPPGGGGGYPGGMPPGGGYPGGGGAGGDYEGGDYEGGMDLYSQYGGSTMMSEKTRVRRSAGVSVRLTVNLQQQRALLRKALHLGSSFEESQREILYTDVQVQRRQKQTKHNAWGEWEDVSSEDLGEILEDSFGIDRDVVNPGVTRNTITMPLPRLASGEWTAAQVSHPDLENFVLSDAEKALIDEWNAKVTERLAEEKKDAPLVVEPKGFSGFVQTATDMGAMYGSGMGSGGGYESGSGDGGAGYEDMYDNMSSGGGDGGKLTASEKEILDATSATAEKRLLLVRFLDFTVERGYSYQYRVRLEMKNPNYNKPLDELEDPSLGAEPTLVSGWSPETPPAFVPEAHRLYVADVNTSSGQLAKVKMTVFTETTETGLPIIGNVNVDTGMPIGGTVRQEVVDLTVKAVEERDVAIKTDAVLAGAEEMMRLSTSDHPELKAMLSGLERGATAIPSQVTIVDSYGALKLRAIGDNSLQEKIDNKTSTFLVEEYSKAWKTATPGGSFFGDDGDDEGEGSGGYMGMSAGSSSAGGFFGGGGETGKRLSSRAKARAKREAKKNGTMMGGRDSAYEN